MGIRTVTAAIVSSMAFSAASAVAGPITWSYSSEGARSGGYSLTGTPLTVVQAESWQLSQLLPYSDFTPRESIGGVSPRLLAKVTLTDQASDASVTFEVPYAIFEREGDDYGPYLGGFARQRFVLGRNTYEVTAPDGLRDLAVGVEAGAPAATPEPASLVLAAVGLAGVGLTRLRARRAG